MVVLDKDNAVLQCNTKAFGNVENKVQLCKDMMNKCAQLYANKETSREDLRKLRDSELAKFKV